VFAQELPGPPVERPGIQPVEAIRLQDENIRFRPMPRYSPREKDCIKTEITKLLQQGLIQPSNSPFGSPVLFVKKKDGSLRMVIDYRAVNAKTFRNHWPLPRIDDLLDKLQGASHFSALDLTSGYYQLPMQASDIPKTAFVTPEGMFEFKVLSQGLCNSPAVFAQTMSQIFKPYLNKFVLIYLDDILVFSKSEEEHYQHLKQVLQLLRNYKLYAKASKCQFMQKELHISVMSSQLVESRLILRKLLLLLTGQNQRLSDMCVPSWVSQTTLESLFKATAKWYHHCMTLPRVCRASFRT
jgi:hypothetical protein